MSAQLQSDLTRGPTSWRFYGEIIKRDDAQRLVFGWLYKTHLADGTPLIDHSREFVTLDVLEKAAYRYAELSRVAGDEHEKDAAGNIISVGKLVVNVVFTPELRKAMDSPVGPMGWFVGYRIENDSTWASIVSGRLKMFSFGGNATGVPLKADSLAAALDHLAVKYGPETLANLIQKNAPGSEARAEIDPALMELRELEVDEGSLVEDGDNPGADVVLFKHRRGADEATASRWATMRETAMNIFQTKAQRAEKAKKAAHAKLLKDAADALSAAAAAASKDEHEPDPKVGVSLDDILPILQDVLTPEQLEMVMAAMGQKDAPAEDAPEEKTSDDPEGGEAAGPVTADTDKNSPLGKANTRIAKLEANAKASEDKAAILLWKSRVKDELGDLAADPDELGPTLKRLHDGSTTEDDVQVILQILAAANETAKVAGGQLEAEIGANTMGGAIDGRGEISKLADEFYDKAKKEGRPIKRGKARHMAFLKARELSKGRR